MRPNTKPITTDRRSGGEPFARTSRAGRAFAWFALVVSSAWVTDAQAREGESPASAPLLCGTLERASGQVQLLDATRTQLIDPSPKMAIPCGTWASIGPGPGWVILRHRNGFRIYAGPGAFFQVSTDERDNLILYRGELYVQSQGAGPELSVLTANARASLGQGTMVVLFSQAEEESQVIALEHTATIENRFQDSTKVKVRAGEASSLNLKLLRTVPTQPMAVSIAGLKGKLASFPVSAKDEHEAIRATHERQETKFPDPLPPPTGGRSLASERPSASPSASYERNPAQKGDGDLRTRFADQVVGGTKEGRALLFPGQKKKAPIRVVDKDKSELMEELSRVRPD